MPPADSAIEAPRARPAPTRRGRGKLQPEPAVRAALLTAASEIIRERGVRGFTVADVLTRAALGTRAFYRHFDSKDQLIESVFLELANVEMRRLRRRVAAAGNPVAAVAAWIDGRLDLAFDETVRSDLRTLSQEAQAQMFTASGSVNSAYRRMLAPLVSQLELGKRQGIFADIEPVTDAELLHGAVWARVQRQWATGAGDRARARAATLRFCLSALGAPEQLIAQAIGRG